MENSTERENQNNNLLQEIVKFASFQPFVGLSASILSTLFLFFRNKPWSWAILFYIFIPFLVFTAIYTFIAIYMKHRHGINIPFFNKKIKIMAIILLILLITANIILWKVKSVRFTNISLENLSSVTSEIPISQKYFVLFSSKNCIYCNL